MLKNKYFNRCNGVSFLTAFTTLATQILVFRIISAKLLNNLAFLVISMTMLGFALSGVILAFNYNFIKRFRKSIHLFTFLYVLTLLLSTILFYHLPIKTLFSKNIVDYTKIFLSFICLSSLFVVPFTFCGLILGVLLSHKKLPTRKIYCFDLIGSALGALLIIFLISFIGVEKSLLILSGGFLVGINILFPLRSKKFKRLTGFMLIVIFILFLFNSRIFQMKYPVGSHLTRYEMEHFEWDPITRIEVSKFNTEKDILFDLALVGTNKNFHNSIHKVLTQNNNAGTLAPYYDGNIESLKGIEETLYHSSYQATSVSSPNVLVVGVGGGMDILAALNSNAASVTGVEINGATHKILRKVYADYFKNWVNDPRVHLVHDEGRHYISKTNKLYDIIQLTGVDSYTGTMASSNIFSENYLYTKEAVKLYFERLTDQGIINIIRLEFPRVPREVIRMLTTVVETLREQGIEEPAKHIVTITYNKHTLAALLIKKTPFTENEIKKLKEWTAHNPYLYFSSTDDLSPHQERIYQFFLNLKNVSAERSFIKRYPLNISPVEDDRPFFFRYTKWEHLNPNFRVFNFTIIPIFEYNIILLLLILTFLCWICIQLPIKHLLKLNFNIKGLSRYVFIFSFLGLGYFFIEIAFMQKLGLFLGHPNLAISIVLSSLLLSTGIGSMYSKNIIHRVKKIKYISYCLCLLILAEYHFILPHLNQLIYMNLLIKGVIALIVLFPIGAILGVFMPTAIDQLKRISPKYVPWGWGINGVFSVIAPIIAIAISVTFGISLLLLCAIPLYLTVGFLLKLK